MTVHPWHPRVAPWVTYMALLAVVVQVQPRWPVAYPFVYAVQCGLVGWLLWRYRRLVPELTLRFHVLAVPAGLGVAWLWVWMGLAMTRLFPQLFADAGTRRFFDADQMGPGLGWVAFALRLGGMSVVVPLFEELFNRSVLLRCLHRPGPAKRALVAMLEDMPVLGDWLLVRRPASVPASGSSSLGAQFERTPLGTLSVFGVCASTAVFVAAHHPRDWPACFLCGVIYCLVLAATRARGLGPVVWTHGITNAALWAYTLYTDDWRFL